MARDVLVGRALGPYEIESRLGGGGMATVYRGVHRALAQPRAVKVMSSSLASHDSFVRLFYREARLAAGLRHPNIVQIHDIAEQDGQHYLVMELLEGRSLRDVIRQESPLSLARVEHLLRQLADALDYAHQNGVAHRDVKPANAFVSAGDRLTLVDFGIARAAGATHMTVTHSIGTPEYMAPEVFDEQLVAPDVDDHQLGIGNDLYALGVVAYEMLAGRAPFTGRTYQAIAYAAVNRPPAPLVEARSDLTSAVEAVVMRQLAKDPQQRYRPALAFVDALAAAIHQPQAAARPPAREDHERTTPFTVRVQASPDEKTVSPQSLPAGLSATVRAPAVSAILPSADRSMPKRVPLVVAVLVLGVALGAIVGLAALVARPLISAESPSPVVAVPPTVAPTAAIARPPSANSTPSQPQPSPESEAARYQREAPQRLQAVKDLLGAPNADAEKALVALTELDQKLPQGSEYRQQVKDLTYRAYAEDAQRRLQVALGNNDLDVLTESRKRFAKALETKPGDPAALAGQDNVQLAEWRITYEKLYKANDPARIDDRIELLRSIRDKRRNYDGAQWSVKEKLYAELIAKAKLLRDRGNDEGVKATLVEAEDVNPDGREAPELMAQWYPTPVPTPVPVAPIRPIQPPSSTRGGTGR